MRALNFIFYATFCISAVSLAESVVYDIPARWPSLGQPVVHYIRRVTQILAKALGMNGHTFAYWQGIVTVILFTVSCLSLYLILRSGNKNYSFAKTLLFASGVISCHQWALYLLTNDIEEHVAVFLPAISNWDVMLLSTGVFTVLLLLVLVFLRRTKRAPQGSDGSLSA